jgi:ubiquinone biosynthesis protein COQ4
MSKDKQNQPYLLRGLQTLATESSTLISSSAYLNDPRLRDWIATHFLRRSGKDRPTSADAYQLYAFLFDLQDLDRIEELFTQERAARPELDGWFNKGFVSHFTKEDLLDCPIGSLGRIFGDYLRDNGFELDIVERFEPRTQYDYYRFRSGQTHDLEHIMFGGAFDILGELVPYYARLTNIPRFLGPELAAQVNLGQQLGAQRVLMRTALHYQQSYLKALEATRVGMDVGLNSEPMFLISYEDVLHLPVEEARRVKGIRGARDVDTRAASLEWDEYRPD